MSRQENYEIGLFVQPRGATQTKGKEMAGFITTVTGKEYQFWTGIPEIDRDSVAEVQLDGHELEAGLKAWPEALAFAVDDGAKRVVVWSGESARIMYDKLTAPQGDMSTFQKDQVRSALQILRGTVGREEVDAACKLLDAALKDNK